MAKVDKLLKLIQAEDIVSSLDDDTKKRIVDDVITGTEIDEATRQEWVEINREAVGIVKQLESGEDTSRVNLYQGQCRVIYPLLAPAIIQLAARMSKHTKRNNRTLECSVLGRDKQIPDPEEQAQIDQMMSDPRHQALMAQAQQASQQTGQPMPQPPQARMVWEKAERARKTSDFVNFKLLYESATWLKEDHTADTIAASWGVSFKQVYYDYVTGENCHEVLDPEYVIINHNVPSIEKAPRVTVRMFLTKNDIMEKVNSGYFSDIDLEKLDTSKAVDTQSGQSLNATNEKNPVYEFYSQHCYLDLDEDGYAEPYKVFVAVDSKQLAAIVPAFDPDLDIILYKGDKASKKGNIVKINRRLDIIDRHLIASPDGKYWSLGLNSLLLHSNKVITSIQRQLVDAGTLKNAAAVSGFVTNQFRTREQEITLELGKFTVLDCSPTIDPRQHIIPMPFSEPSTVLLELLKLLIDTSKNTGYISDVLTGDVEMQNVPATTALAMVEQSTRAFAPIIQNKQISLKNEFRLVYYLNSKYLDETQYIHLNNDVTGVTKEDFDLTGIDITPVADPTMASEAHGYAQARALIEAVPVFGNVMNLQEAATRFFTQMQFPNPDKLISEQQQQQPDPKMMIAQLKAQTDQQKLQLQNQDNIQKNQIAAFEAQTKASQVNIKANESQAKQQKMKADAAKDFAMAHVANKQAHIHERKVELESEKNDLLRLNAQNKL